MKKFQQQAAQNAAQQQALMQAQVQYQQALQQQQQAELYQQQQQAYFQQQAQAWAIYQQQIQQQQQIIYVQQQQPIVNNVALIHTPVTTFVQQPQVIYSYVYMYVCYIVFFACFSLTISCGFFKHLSIISVVSLKRSPHVKYIRMYVCLNEYTHI